MPHDLFRSWPGTLHSLESYSIGYGGAVGLSQLHGWQHWTRWHLNHWSDWWHVDWRVFSLHPRLTSSCPFLLALLTAFSPVSIDYFPSLASMHPAASLNTASHTMPKLRHIHIYVYLVSVGSPPSSTSLDSVVISRGACVIFTLLPCCLIDELI